MKKFLSLVAIMLLSTLLFTSCDISSFMPSTPQETRHTIYESEWNATLNATNFTCTQKTDSGTITFMATQNAFKIIKDGEVDSFIINKNGATYKVEENGGEWIETEIVGQGWQSRTLSNVMDILNAINFFETFVYNEATESYVYEANGETAEFYFESGRLVRGTIGDEYTISDVDRTYISISPSNSGNTEGDQTGSSPNQSIVKIPEKGEKITEEIWNATLETNNFYCLGVVEENIEGSLLQIPERPISCTDNSIYRGGDWYEIKIGDFWYKLVNNQEQYFAELSLTPQPRTIKEAANINNVSFSDLHFDESKGCYSYEEKVYTDTNDYDISTSYIYFSKGVIDVIERIEPAYNSDGSKTTKRRFFDFKNVGYITHDEIPEYTIGGKEINDTDYNALINSNEFTSEIKGFYFTKHQDGYWFISNVNSKTTINGDASILEYLYDAYLLSFEYSDLVFNSDINAYETQCSVDFNDQIIELDVAVNFVDESTICIYVNMNYDLPGVMDVAKITISDIK